MVQAEVCFWRAAKRSALVPEGSWIGGGAGDGDGEGIGDGSPERGDREGVVGERFLAEGVFEEGREEGEPEMGPAGRRRVRPAGSQASFFPERRSSWT